VPVDCNHPLLARIGIGGDGIGSRFQPPCTVLDSDVHARIDERRFDGGALGGEFEGECEDVFFLPSWDTLPADLATSRVSVADDSAILSVDVMHLFGERWIDAPTALHPGDHVDARIALAELDTIAQGTAVVCDGDCPKYVPSTLTDRTLAFDVPADATGPMKISASVDIPIERCDGANQCTASTGVSIAVPVVR
jgi:hypothetical protein